MENQPSYTSAYEDEEEIDLVALMFTLLHQYRQILAGALACAVIFGAAAGAHSVLSGAASKEAQAAYETEMADYRSKEASYEAAQKQYEADVANNEKSQSDTETAIRSAQEYANGSVLNNLDPYNVWMARADLYISTNYQIQPGMTYQNPDRTNSVLSAYASVLSNGATLNEVAETVSLQERYLQELVTVEADPDTHLLSITVMGRDEQMANTILDALLDHMNNMNANISAAVGSHTVSTIARSSYCTVSTSLRDAQSANNSALIDLQSQIDSLQQSRTQLDENFAAATKTWQETSEPVIQSARISADVGKFGLIGLLVGFVLVCGVGTVKFLAQGKVYSGKELKTTCDLPLLGALASEKSKKAKKLDAAIDRMEGRPDGSKDAEMIRLIAATIRSRAPEAARILVTGDLPAEQLNTLAAALQNTEVLRAQTVTAAESILQSSATVAQVTGADAIVLAADCTCSRYAAVKDQNEQINRLGKKILGCVVFE